MRLLQVTLFISISLLALPLSYAGEDDRIARKGADAPMTVVFNRDAVKGEPKIYSVGSNTKLKKGALFEHVCAVALQGLAGKRAGSALALASGKLPEGIEARVQVETYESGRQFRQRGKPDEISSQIKQDLMTAKVQNREGHYVNEYSFPFPEDAPGAKNSARKGALLTEDFFGDLISIEINVRLGDREVPVIVKRVESGSAQKGPRLLLVPQSWAIEAGEPIAVNPRLAKSNPKDEDVFLMTGDEFDLIPAEVRAKIYAYDFWSESIQLPHSVGSYNCYVNTCDNDYSLRGAQIYKVQPKGAKKPIGYVVDAIFTSHIEIPLYIYGEEIIDSAVLYRARFDAQGNRADFGGENVKQRTRSTKRAYPGHRI